MHILTANFISLKSLTPIRMYKNLDGWLLGSGQTLRVKTQNKQLLVKRFQGDQWHQLHMLWTRDYWQLLCPFCGARSDILYWHTDYRCRLCVSKQLPQEQNIRGRTVVKRQAVMGDYSLLHAMDDRRIAMRLLLEEKEVLNKLLSPVPEIIAVSKIRFEKCIEPRIILEPIKNGRLLWIQGKYIWVNGQ